MEYSQYCIVIHVAPPAPPSLSRAYVLEQRSIDVPRYSVVCPCAPLLRVSPDLDSTPVAQLSFSSGIVYTADPSRSFGSCPAPAAATAATTACEPHLAPPTAPAFDVTAAMAAPKSAAEESGSSPGKAAAEAAANPPKSQPLAPAVKSEKEEETPAAAAASQHPWAHPSEHPLVLSGRRVWVISPVVGWASVWAETEQRILTPAGIEEAEGTGNTNAGGRPILASPPIAVAPAGMGAPKGVLKYTQEVWEMLEGPGSAKGSPAPTNGKVADAIATAAAMSGKGGNTPAPSSSSCSSSPPPLPLPGIIPLALEDQGAVAPLSLPPPPLLPPLPPLPSSTEGLAPGGASLPGSVGYDSMVAKDYAMLESILLVDSPPPPTSAPASTATVVPTDSVAAVISTSDSGGFTPGPPLSPQPPWWPTTPTSSTGWPSADDVTVGSVCTDAATAGASVSGTEADAGLLSAKSTPALPSLQSLSACVENGSSAVVVAPSDSAGGSSDGGGGEQLEGLSPIASEAGEDAVNLDDEAKKTE